MNEVIKFDNDQKLVFGWANIIKDADGETYIDTQGDFIDDIAELEKSAYDYVLHSRNGAEMHVNQNVARVVESFVVTPDKLEALGLVAKSDVIPAGWWIGFKVDDDSVWGKIKDGSYTGFSVHGKGQREIVDMTNNVEKGGAGYGGGDMKAHSKKFSAKHIKDMKKKMQKGLNFAEAHKASLQDVGKGVEDSYNLRSIISRYNKTGMIGNKRFTGSGKAALGAAIDFATKNAKKAAKKNKGKA